MPQSYAPSFPRSTSLQQLQGENAKLQKYLAAQKAVIGSLERRVGRSLESLEGHLHHLATASQESETWQAHLGSVQSEVDGLCDLVADTMLLQKLEVGKVAVNLEPLDLQPLLVSVTRHLLVPKAGAPRLVCEVDAALPLALADPDLTEAVLTDLLTRSLKYSDPDLPIVLKVERSTVQVHLSVTAQRFAPPGNRDFATEIVLCCRRIEVQGGEVVCQPRSDGLQTVTATLQIAPSHL